MYSISAQEAGRFRSLTSAVRDFGPNKIEDAGENSDFFFDMEEDAGFGATGSCASSGMPTCLDIRGSSDSAQASDMIVFRIVSLRPVRMKLPQTDKRPGLVWSDMAVSLLPIQEIASQDRMWVSATPDLPTASSMQILSKGGFSSVKVWKLDPKLRCFWGEQHALPEPLSEEDLNVAADALVQAGAFPGGVKGLDASAVSDAVRASFDYFKGLDLAAVSGSGLWQITQHGVSSLRMAFSLSKVEDLVNLEESLPMSDRSESALLLFLKQRGWQLYSWVSKKGDVGPKALSLIPSMPCCPLHRNGCMSMLIVSQSDKLILLHLPAQILGKRSSFSYASSKAWQPFLTCKATSTTRNCLRAD